jgi:hypothetical protein
VVDSNADPIAGAIVRRLRTSAAEMESEVNRLYRGRNAFELGDLAASDLERVIGRLKYMAEPCATWSGRSARWPTCKPPSERQAPDPVRRPASAMKARSSSGRPRTSG